MGSPVETKNISQSSDRASNTSATRQVRITRLGIVVYDPGFTEYTRFFASHEKNRKLFGSLSLVQVINSNVGSLFGALIDNMPPEFFNKVFSDLTQTPVDIHQEIFLKFVDCRKTGKTGAFAGALSRILNISHNEYSHIVDRCQPQFSEVFNIHVLFNSSFPLEILDRSPLSLHPEYQLAPSDYPMAAASSCVSLFSNLWVLSGALNSYLRESEINVTFQLFKNVIDVFYLDSIYLNDDKILNRTQRNSLLFFERSVRADVHKKYTYHFFTVSDYFIYFNNDYAKVLSSGKPELFFSSISENRDLMECFLPQVIEFREFVDHFYHGFEQISLYLKYLPLYLRLSDLDHFKERMEQNQPVKFGAILDEELQRFAKDCEVSNGLKFKLLQLLKSPENRSLMDLYKSVGAMRLKLSQVHSLVHWFLDPAIAAAETLSPHLFPEASVREKRGAVPVTPDEKGLSPNEEEETEPVDVSTVAKQGTPQLLAIPFAQRLQTIKTGMSDSLQFIGGKCKEFGVREALANCDAHWECLLVCMKRLVETKGAMSNPGLYSTIVDIVRESALVIEQSLSALDRKSNQVKDRETLKGHLTHHLVQILWSCKWTGGTLPSQFRKWIHQMNYGEILSRNPAECCLRGTYVESLLAKACLGARNSTALSRREVIAHAVEYFKRTGLLCLELQKQMTGVHKHVHSLQGKFLELCREITLSLSVEPERVERPLGDALNGIISPVAALREIVPVEGIQSSLDNVLQNLCLQLQVEMSLHATLEPIDAYRHLSKSILLNQMIAEQYLLSLHDALEIPYKLEEVGHDLATLAGSIGMSDRDFSRKEWEFLSHGKATRLLARYPQSYVAIYKKDGPAHPRMERAFQDAVALSSTQVFQQGNVAAGGFVVASPRLDAIKSLVVEEIQTLSAILGKIARRTHPGLGFGVAEGKRD